MYLSRKSNQDTLALVGCFSIKIEFFAVGICHTSAPKQVYQ